MSNPTSSKSYSDMTDEEKKRQLDADLKKTTEYYKEIYGQGTAETRPQLSASEQEEYKLYSGYGGRRRRSRKNCGGKKRRTHRRKSRGGRRHKRSHRR